MPGRSIGEVLEELKGDFPDISVSKIRFLESQGLVTPQRTPSGYRQFGEDDVRLLRWILAQQRDHYLPLKVIRSRLRGGAQPWLDDGPQLGHEGQGDDGQGDEGIGRAGAEAPAPAPAAALSVPAVPAGAPAGPSPDPERTYTRSELAKAAGVAEPAIAELESFGLLPERLDDHALQIARLAGAFFAYGVEARHLRMYKSMAEREATFFEQVVQPVTARREPGADAAADALSQLAGLGGALRESLLRQALGVPGPG